MLAIHLPRNCDRDRRKTGRLARGKRADRLQGAGRLAEADRLAGAGKLAEADRLQGAGRLAGAGRTLAVEKSND